MSLRSIKLLLFFVFAIKVFYTQSKPSNKSIQLSDTVVVNKLIDNYRALSHQSIDSAKKQMLHALSLSINSNYLYGKINSYRLIADAYALLFNYDTALFYLDTAELLANQINDRKAKANILNLRGNISSDKGDFKRAIAYYDKVIEISEEIDFKKGLYKGYANTGVSHHLSGNFSLAISNYSKTIPIMEELNDSMGLSIINTNLSGLYQQIEMYEMANECCMKALSYMEENDKWGYASVYINLGKNLKELNQPDEALKHYQMALELGKEINDRQIMLNAYNNIGDIYINVKTNNYKKGIVFLNMALDIAEEFEMTNDKAHLNYVLALAYLNKGFYQQSIDRAKKALEIATKNQLNETISYALKTLATCYFQLEEYKLSSEYYLKYADYRDSLNSDDFTTKLSEMKAKFEVDKLKEEKLASEAINKERADKDRIAREKVENERNLLIIMGTLLMIIVLSITYFLFQYRKNNKLINAQKKKVESQKNIIQLKNKDLTDSIKYAERIQKTILPNNEKIKKLFSDYFIMYRPKDIVAGDFYWAEMIEGYHFIAVADCTGHGVPGAIVSVICHNALNRSIKEFSLRDPGKILDKARMIIVDELSKNNQEDVKDGMDVSLCVIKQNTLIFSGANNPLWYVRDNELHVVKGDKQPVGIHEVMNDFSSTEIKLEKGDAFYLFSDGYIDQFGGEKNKKLKSSGLKKLILKVCDEPMEAQNVFFNQHFKNWKGNCEQMDDVCLIGFRI